MIEHGTIGAFVRSAADDEAAAAEPLQPVPVLEALAQPLVALGEHGGELARRRAAAAASVVQAMVWPALRASCAEHG